MLLELASLLSLPFTDKIRNFDHLTLNPTLQLINGILSDLQNLLRYFDDKAVVVFLKIPFDSSASVFTNNLKLLVLTKY